jgi:ankyrin repeat protein
LIIEAGIDLNSKNYDSKTPIQTGIKYNSVRFFKTLFEKGFLNINYINEHKGLFLAAESNSKEILELFIQYGADVNKTNWHGQTPLFFAAEHDAWDITELMIKNGANVNFRDKKMCTPLFMAVKHNKKKAVEILLNHGAKVNARDKDSNTPLFYVGHFYDSNKTQFKEMAELLIEHGADVNAKNRLRETPIFNAIREDLVDVVKFLVKNKADLTIQNTGFEEDGYQDKICSPLELAKECRKKDIYKILLKEINGTI